MNTQNHPSVCQSGSFMLARFAARFSVIAPVAAFVIRMITQQSPSVSDARTSDLVIVVYLALAILAVALVILGIISGIAALIATRRYGRDGIFGWSLAGTLLCGVWLLYFAYYAIVVALLQFHAHQAA